MLKLCFFVAGLFLPFAANAVPPKGQLSEDPAAQAAAAHPSPVPTGEEKIPGKKFFKDPKTIFCMGPHMVTFRHEGTVPDIAHGHYGEEAAESIFKKCAAFPEANIDHLKTTNSKGTGYDFVIVDHDKRVVFIMEAKSTSARDGTLFSRKVPKGDMPSALKDIGANMEREDGERVRSDLSKLLKKTPSGVYQLSRTWCEGCLEDSIDPSKSKWGSSAKRFKELLENLIEKEGYKFARFASLTYVWGKAGDASIMPSLTYYFIIRDGDSTKEEPEKEDRLKRHGIENGGLGSEAFWDTQEWGIDPAIQYLRERCAHMQGYRFPVEFIDYSSPHLPLPPAAGALSTTAAKPTVPETKEAPKDKVHDVKAGKGAPAGMSRSGLTSDPQAAAAFDVTTEKPAPVKAKRPHGDSEEGSDPKRVKSDSTEASESGLVSGPTAAAASSEALRERTLHPKAKRKGVSDDEEEEEDKRRKLDPAEAKKAKVDFSSDAAAASDSSVQSVSLARKPNPGVIAVLHEFIHKGTSPDLLQQRLEEIKSAGKEHRMALALLKGLKGEDLSDEEKRDIAKYHGRINLWETYVALKTSGNKTEVLAGVLKKLRDGRKPSKDKDGHTVSKPSLFNDPEFADAERVFSSDSEVN